MASLALGYVVCTSRAEIIIDPENVGATGVNNPGAWLNGGLISNDIGIIDGILGYNNTDGTVLINANGRSRFLYLNSLTLGQSGEGKLMIEAFNTEAATDRAMYVGQNYHGTVEVKNGGTLITDLTSSGHTYIGWGGNSGFNPSGTGTMTVVGQNSRWISSFDNPSGRVIVGHNAEGTVNLIHGGSYQNETGSLYIGGFEKGTVNVKDGGTIVSSNYLGVGRAGEGVLNIESTDASATQVNTTTAQLGGYSGGFGTTTVKGEGAVWNIQNLAIGSDQANTGSGALNIVHGGLVNVSESSQVADHNSGTVNVTGNNSTWNIDGDLSVAHSGKGTVNIADGGQINVGDDITLNDGGGAGTATFNFTVYGDDMVNAGTDGSGSFINNGTVNLFAAPDLAAGTAYRPISAANGYGGTGTYQAFGGTWDSANHTFTASTVGSGALENTDLSGVRQGFDGNLLIVGFNANEGTGSFDAMHLTNDSLRIGQGRLSIAAYDFTTDVTELTLISIFIGEGYDLAQLSIWHQADGSSIWNLHTDNDFVYSAGWIYFTASEFSSYAVTVPEPSTAGLLLLAGSLLAARRRKR